MPWTQYLIFKPTPFQTSCVLPTGLLFFSLHLLTDEISVIAKIAKIF